MLLIDCFNLNSSFCAGFKQTGVPVLLNDPLVVALAAEIGKTPAQVFEQSNIFIIIISSLLLIPYVSLASAHATH